MLLLPVGFSSGEDSILDWDRITESLEDDSIAHFGGWKAKDKTGFWECKSKVEIDPFQRIS